MIISTHHFTTRQAAIKYLAKKEPDTMALIALVQDKLAHGEIAIGKPDMFFHVESSHGLWDVSCWADRDGRYHIETK